MAGCVEGMVGEVATLNVFKYEYSLTETEDKQMKTKFKANSLNFRAKVTPMAKFFT